MRRATITLSDDLDVEVERFRLAQPARPALTSVVRAALESYLATRNVGAPPPTVLGRVLRRRADVRRIVAEHGGRDPRLFGSVARGDAGDDSDVDLLIDLAPGEDAVRPRCHARRASRVCWTLPSTW